MIWIGICEADMRIATLPYKHSVHTKDYGLTSDIKPQVLLYDVKRTKCTPSVVDIRSDF